MFKAVRITILLFVLFMVATGTWLTKLRSTDWNNSLWVKIYPINGDGSDASSDYIAGLGVDTFAGIEEFLAREVRRYGHAIERPASIPHASRFTHHVSRGRAGRFLGSIYRRVANDDHLLCVISGPVTQRQHLV